MKLKNRFKNRFISHDDYVQWFTAKDFRASVICTLARNDRAKEQTEDFFFGLFGDIDSQLDNITCYA